MAKHPIRTHSRPAAVALALLVAAAASVAFPSAALAKDYSMPSVDITADMRPDGSLDVTERRTYDFDGDFTRVYWDIPVSPDIGVEVLGATGQGGTLRPTTAEGRPPGTYRVTQDPEGKPGVRVEMYGTYASETIPFVLRLRYSGAVKRYADTAELYWKAIGPDWQKGAGSVSITIRPPRSLDATQVRAWVHGPLTGVVRIGGGGVVTARVDDLPSYTSVEPRVVLPPESVPDAAVIPTDRLHVILAEEQAWAETANARREQARRQAAEDARFQGGAAWSGAGLALIGLIAVAVLFFAFGKEHRPAFQGPYFREPPADLHPGLVSYLMNMGTVLDSSMSATLMDLADRGAVTMEPVTVQDPGFLGIGAHDEPTYQLTVDTSKWYGLRPLDRSLLTFLFTDMAGDNRMTLDELKAIARSRPKEFQDGVMAFRKAVADEADTLGWMELPGRRARVAAWLITAVFGLGSCSCAFASANFYVLAFEAAALVTMAVLAHNTKRRSPEAAELFAKYSAVRNYLRDFSRLNEAPPSSVVLWNQFLVLAVVFGIAEQVIEQMKVVVPQVVADPAFGTTYWWASSGAGYQSPVSSLTGGFASAASIASSELSSSSGGGGGFSGGGGGGFGGGGGGAD